MMAEEERAEKMESVQSRLYKQLLRLIRLKQRMESDTIKELRRRKLRKRQLVMEGAKFQRLPFLHVIMKKVWIKGSACFKLLPERIGQKGFRRPERALIFLHGGSYMNGLFPMHWQYAAKIARDCDMEVWLPDYPLAPQGTYRESFAMIERLYQGVRRSFPPDRIWLMGDSAGGGFALAFAQRLIAAGERKPAGVILFSPWLDVSMENPEISELEGKDPFLNRQALVAAGLAYAGGDGGKIPQVSPIYGALKGLPPIHLFTGTCDILCADARKFQRMCREQGVLLNYQEYPEMLHDFMLGPLPEAKLVYQEVKQILGNENMSGDIT